MQKSKTLEFWDDFYEKEASESNDTEWILEPSESILNSILSYLPTYDEMDMFPFCEDSIVTTVLEIGCGNSKFSLHMWKHLQTLFSDRSSTACTSRLRIIATDVSPICIEQNIQRDREVIESCCPVSSFQYEVLNVLEEPDKARCRKHAIVLDKGCFDTFLFRSKKTKAGQYSPLVEKLLNNIHKLLQRNGKYIVFSPRKKIKALRNFNGFCSVKMKRLNSVEAIIGALDGRAERNDTVYMHVCTKEDAYIRDNDGPSFRNQTRTPSDDEICGSCGLSFLNFRNGEELSGKCVTYWGRTWQGHMVHCTNILS